MPLAVLMVDIDHFELVNEQYGHRAVDQVLVSVVRTLELYIRKDAFIGRYDYRGQIIKAIISIGATVVTKDKTREYDDPLMLADKAWYAAKKQGRDCVVIYGEPNITASQQAFCGS
ncbi:MAG: GGDEF domain-containing protein [Methylophaga sp.]|nr:GGDEF domain-containing protein [Methylophaga sp.]